jgi:hypothetical protein
MSDSRKLKFKTLDNNLTDLIVDPNVTIVNIDNYCQFKASS